MSSNANIKSGGSISFLGLLTIVFITLKLCSVIDWSWWWILSPLWLPVALVISVLLVLALLTGVGHLILHKK